MALTLRIHRFPNWTLISLGKALGILDGSDHTMFIRAVRLSYSHIFSNMAGVIASHLDCSFQIQNKEKLLWAQFLQPQQLHGFLHLPTFYCSFVSSISQFQPQVISNDFIQCEASIYHFPRKNFVLIVLFNETVCILLKIFSVF